MAREIKKFHRYQRKLTSTIKSTTNILKVCLDLKKSLDLKKILETLKSGATKKLSKHHTHNHTHSPHLTICHRDQDLDFFANI